jgi:hypothetical protein
VAEKAPDELELLRERHRKITTALPSLLPSSSLDPLYTWAAKIPSSANEESPRRGHSAGSGAYGCGGSGRGTLKWATLEHERRPAAATPAVPSTEGKREKEEGLKRKIFGCLSAPTRNPRGSSGTGQERRLGRWLFLDGFLEGNFPP